MRKKNRQVSPADPAPVGSIVPENWQGGDVMLRLEHITYRYSAGTPFEVKALDDVTLDIRRGRITGLIGHTGSGKSTLVQLLNGLTRPEAGRVLLDGQDIWQDLKQIGKVRFRVGLVMQYPEYQLFEETVRADIAFGPRNMQLSGEEIAERVDEAAAFAGVLSYEEAFRFVLLRAESMAWQSRRPPPEAVRPRGTPRQSRDRSGTGRAGCSPSAPAERRPLRSEPQQSRCAFSG